MSKITLENNMPCTVIAVLGDENDKESKELRIQMVRHTLHLKQQVRNAFALEMVAHESCAAEIRHSVFLLLWPYIVFVFHQHLSW